MTAILGWRRALVAVIAAAASAVLLAVPAAAEEPVALGWWWIGRPTAMLPAVFAPTPQPPEGGLYVAGGPAGPAGVAALRFQLDPEATGARLTLNIAQADGTPVIDACAPAATWQPAENGGWDQRPEPDCAAGSVTGRVNADTTEVSFSLSFLRGTDGVIDIVLVPGTDAEAQSPAGFAVAFTPPSASALVATKPTAADAGTVGSTPEPDFAPPLIPSPLILPGLAAVPSAEEFGEFPDTAPATQRPAFATGAVESEEGFIYAAVLMLPLVLLLSASYLGWTLTRPIVVTRRARP